MPKAEIAVIGGSGFYQLFKNSHQTSVITPYGKPSDKLSLAVFADRKVVFLPRHGLRHQFPPHKINYLANLHAFKQLGVEWILGPSACGSLKKNIKPGDFIICDQFIDRTKDRVDTYYHGPKVVHLSASDPYCPTLRQLAYKTCRKLNITVHSKGTVVVVNGPRFSTKAESRYFADCGWDVINMTQYPEAILARELKMCYVNLSLVTDYDAGIKDNPKIKPVYAAEVARIFKANNQKVLKLIKAMIKEIPKNRQCSCAQALDQATL